MTRLRSDKIWVVLAVGALTTVLGGCELITSVDSSEIPTEDQSSARGVLGGYQNGHVFGWAALADDGTAQVTITVDGADVATVSADNPRSDLVDAGVHSTGNAGFDVDVGELDSGTEIRAIIDQEGLELTNSPLTVP